MNNTFGTALTFTLFGESHGETMGCVLDGLPAGLSVSEETIARQLSLRRPQKEIGTSRVEPDAFRVVSGVFQGKATGSPLTILVENNCQRSSDYALDWLRPSHGDYPRYVKYGGLDDYRGGGHGSGRLTAPLVAVGGILLPILETKNIKICTHIKELGGISDDNITENAYEALQNTPFPVVNEEKGNQMKNVIKDIAKQGDSLGGILETSVFGLPVGLGEPWFDSVEGMLSHALFSVPAVKAIAFGDGFDFAHKIGSEALDSMQNQNGKIAFTANHNGGVLGGITNGNVLNFTLCVKPTPTVSVPVETVNVASGESGMHTFTGRHDPCIVPRAKPSVDALTAFVLCDLAVRQFGRNWLL